MELPSSEADLRGALWRSCRFAGRVMVWGEWLGLFVGSVGEEEEKEQGLRGCTRSVCACEALVCRINFRPFE